MKSAKRDLLLQSWVLFAALASLKEFETHWLSHASSVYECSLAEVICIGPKAQLL